MSCSNLHASEAGLHVSEAGPHASGAGLRASGAGLRARRGRQGRRPHYAILAALFVATSAVAAPLSTERARAILRDALDAYDSGMAAVRTDPTVAQTHFRAAAGGFQALLDAGLGNAALHYNLGNAYWRLDDVGHAVYHYRLAQRIAPSDARVQANLDYVRQRVTPHIVPSDTARIWRQLLFWHYDTAVTTRLWAAAGLGVLGWGLLTLRWRWRHPALLAVGLLAAAGGLAAGASATWQFYDTAHRPAAVILQGTPMLRRGGGEGYEAARTEPLGPGVELRVLSQRGDWTEVVLLDSETGWLPTTTLAVLSP